MRTLLLVALTLLPMRMEAQLRVTSPDGRNAVLVQTHEGKLYYAVQRDGRPLLTPSLLGFQFKNQPPLRDSLRIVDSSRSTFDTIWTQRSEEHTSELQSHSDLVCRL